MPAQANVEYFFRLLYQLTFGGGVVGYSAFLAFIAHLWTWIIVIGYAASVLGLFVIIYTMMRTFELRKREEEFYSTVIASENASRASSARWMHIESLMDSERPSDWREAIMEADIMLDDLLTHRGYKGDGIGEKLKLVEPSDFGSIQDAWEAHKVRNQIAHEGSAFDLNETLARRTIQRYEKVFREFELI